VTVTNQLQAGSAISFRNFTVFNMNDRHCTAVTEYYTLNDTSLILCVQNIFYVFRTYFLNPFNYIFDVRWTVHHCDN